MSLKSLWSSIDEFVTKARFGSRERIDLYQSLALLLDNNVQISDALYELYLVYSDEEKKPGEPLAMVTKECHQAYANGRKLYQALKRWAPHQEVALLEAGEATGALAKALRDAIMAIGYKERIKSAVVVATLYPGFLNSIACVLLWIIANKLVPKMAQLSDPSTWEGVGYSLYVIADVTTNYGAYLVAGTIVLLILIFYSLPRWKGDLRVYADRAPIYSTYRMLHGSTFLLNVSVMIRAGIPMHEALVQLAKGAPPWLYQRIAFAAYGTKQGANLGIALHRAGQNFPDKRAVQFLKILATRSGFEEALHNFSREWLETSIRRVEATAKLTLLFSACLMAALMVVVVVGTYDMQMAIERSVDART
jgi:type II secretory pathway component PulF